MSNPVTDAAAPSRLTERSRWVFAAYIAVGVVHVIAQLAQAQTLTTATKPLLMPLLLLWLLLAADRPLSRPLRALAVGVVFAWLGDCALMGSGDLWFIAGIALFLVMQVCYITAFRRVPGPGLVRAWPIALVPFVLVWLALAATMWIGSGTQALPGLVYGLVLVAMAVSALDAVIRLHPQRFGWHVAIGALMFLVSDGTIALTAFTSLDPSPWTHAFVMATYIAAQALIVTGMVRGTASTDT